MTLFSQDFGFGAYNYVVQASNLPGTVQALYMFKDNNNEVSLSSDAHRPYSD